jgi:hypothetical protein
MNNKDKGNANIGIVICALVLGLVKLPESSSTRPTGRWSLIFGPLFDSFGSCGPAIATLAIGGGLIIFRFFLRGKNELPS